MTKRNITNKDLLKRIETLENRTTVISFIFLLYAMGFAIIISYFPAREIFHLITAILCFSLGALFSYYLSKRKK